MGSSNTARLDLLTSVIPYNVRNKPIAIEGQAMNQIAPYGLLVRSSGNSSLLNLLDEGEDEEEESSEPTRNLPRLLGSTRLFFACPSKETRAKAAALARTKEDGSTRRQATMGILSRLVLDQVQGFIELSTFLLFYKGKIYEGGIK